MKKIGLIISFILAVAYGATDRTLTTTNLLMFEPSAGGADKVTIKPPALSSSWTFTLPTSGGTNGYFLSTNGSGTSSWAEAVTLTGTQTLTNKTISFASNTLTNVQPTSTLTAKGDIYVATASNTVTRLGVGSNGQTLQADSAQPTGIKWAAPASVAMGDTITSATAGSVFFAGTSGVLAQDNSNLYFDDTNNRLGIGTSSPGSRLDVRENQAANSFFDFYNTTNGGGIVWRQIVRDIANTGTTSVDIAKLTGGSFVINNNDTHANNYTSFGIGGTERMRITSSGSVGVGTTSPNLSSSVRALTVNTTNAADQAAIELASGGTLRASLTASNSGSVNLTSETSSFLISAKGASNILTLGTNNTERARLLSDGALNVGTTTTGLGTGLSGSQYALGAQNSTIAAILKSSNGATNETAIIWNSATAGDNKFINFLTEGGTGTARGSIDYNRAGVAVRYNTTSDKRIKTDITDSKDALNIIDQIKVRSYKIKETNYPVSYGFIAQELYKIIPDAVSKGDDNADKITKVWAVDYSKLVPHLTKAIQELHDQNQALEKKVDTLKVLVCLEHPTTEICK